jgi:hypothetical protein
MSLLDPKAMAKVLAEAKSDQQRVLICCDDHSYYPGSKLSRPQMLGCKYCIMARLYHDFSQIPPDQREERSHQLEALVNHMTEDVERGTFDITVYDRPKITVEQVDDDDPQITLTDSI